MVEYRRVFHHVGFFLLSEAPHGRNQLRMESMEKLSSSMARRIAEVASAFEEQGTGHRPKSVTMVLSDSTLVITLHEALIAGRADPVQEPGTADSLRQEIKRITEVEVREAAVEIEPATDAVVKAFTTGTVVQVFLLARGIPAET
jgi:uncharacterized protein YbcI